MLSAVKKCRETFLRETDRKQKAELSQELLALLMYTAITPGRSKEYATLHVEIHEDTLPPLTENPRVPNCIHLTRAGDAGCMVLADHKTAKHYGSARIILHQDSPLLAHLAQHVQRYWRMLGQTEENTFLFVVSVQDAPVHGCMHVNTPGTLHLWSLYSYRIREEGHFSGPSGLTTLKGYSGDMQKKR